MHVDVNQSRHPHVAAQIDDFRSIARHGLDVGIRADDKELAVLDGDRLRPRLGVVHRVDLAVGVGDISKCALLDGR